MPTSSPPDAPRADVDRLVDLVATVESTQRSEHVDGFLALFHPDAVWVTGGGRRLTGLDEISHFTRTVLPGAMRDGTVRYVVEHIRFVTADVAVTWVEQEYLDGAGQSLAPRSLGRPVYTWLRVDGDWLIVAGQNTPVVDGPTDDATEADLAALRAVVQDVQDGFNRNDAALMNAHVGEDAVVVDSAGRALRGRASIVSASEEGLAGPFLRDATAHYRLTDVVSPIEGVYVATKEAWSSEADAASGRPAEMRALYVFVRRSGRWLVERRANVPVRA